ncbi:hypothetical protein [Streptomyces cadmiisoli]|uniref:hypothetical protein n=1 Tax=Streptomyces cadmiisoli TaxID=2184053 RepID=UPI00366795AE
MPRRAQYAATPSASTAAPQATDAVGRVKAGSRQPAEQPRARRLRGRLQRGEDPRADHRASPMTTASKTLNRRTSAAASPRRDACPMPHRPSSVVLPHGVPYDGGPPPYAVTAASGARAPSVGPSRDDERAR